MKRILLLAFISFFLLSSCAVGVSWKPNAVDNVSTTLSEYPEAYTLSNNIIEVDIFKAAAGYNRYYTPDTNEVLIQNERVYVERKVGAAWVPDGVVQSVKIVETDTGYNAIRSYDGVHTFYDVVYVLDDGEPLKFEVNLTAKSEGEYRINWDIQGIMGDNQFIDGGSYKFGVSEDNYKVQIDISDVIEGFGEDYIDVQSSNTVPNGRILDFYFGSFNLGLGENVLVDPTIASSVYVNRVIGDDLDSDGDIDIIISSSEGDFIKWYENDGSESFTEHLIISGIGENGDTLDVNDINSDGEKDIVGVGDGNKISWYENDGSESFTEHVIDTYASSGFIFKSGDVDSDGDEDIVIGIESSSNLNWYENDGNESFTKHFITTTGITLNSYIKIYDLNNDTFNDIITQGYSGYLTWHENDGNESFTKHNIKLHTAGKGYDIGDVDGDSDIDIMSIDGNTIYLHRNDGTETFSTSSITTLTNAYDIKVDDVDGDGDGDFAVAAFNYNNALYYFSNDGSESFTSKKISLFLTGRTLDIKDVDGDTNLDIIGGFTNRLHWYEHTDMDVRTLDLSNAALTGLVVRNGDNIGGFVDGSGYMYFSELEYTPSLYTVSITGSEQDSGMKVQTNTDIDSVSSIKVQFKTLDPAKSYDIYLDDVYKETAYRSGTHDYTYTESGLQTVKLQETKENIQVSLTNLSSSVINASGVTVADAASQNLVSGAATFEPYKYENGIYPINITNTSLADGFNFTLTASGLTAAPTTFNGLDSSKSYHVNYDGGLYANISGVTSYTYNFTSFSTHTVQLVEYTPVSDTVEDEEEPTSVASGLIEIGELTITKEEFDLLTVEQIEALDVSQDTKDQLLRLKTITVNKWKFALGIGFIWLIIEVGKGKKAGFGLVISIALIVFSAYKLGYF